MQGVRIVHQGPQTGGLAVIPVTTSSVAHDLTGANYAGLLKAIRENKPLLLAADPTSNGTVYYRWANVSGGTVDEAATVASSPLNQAASIGPGVRTTQPESIPPDTITLLVKGGAATNLRIWW